jgi:hypothetical protein
MSLELGLYDLRRDVNATKQIWAKLNYKVQESSNEWWVSLKGLEQRYWCPTCGRKARRSENQLYLCLNRVEKHELGKREQLQCSLSNDYTCNRTTIESVIFYAMCHINQNFGNSFFPELLVLYCNFSVNCGQYYTWDTGIVSALPCYTLQCCCIKSKFIVNTGCSIHMIFITLS